MAYAHSTDPISTTQNAPPRRINGIMSKVGDLEQGFSSQALKDYYWGIAPRKNLKESEGTQEGRRKSQVGSGLSCDLASA